MVSLWKDDDAYCVCAGRGVVWWLTICGVILVSNAANLEAIFFYLGDLTSFPVKVLVFFLAFWNCRHAFLDLFCPDLPWNVVLQPLIMKESTSMKAPNDSVSTGQNAMRGLFTIWPNSLTSLMARVWNPIWILVSEKLLGAFWDSFVNLSYWINSVVCLEVQTSLL